MADPVTISAFVASWFTPSSLFLFLNLVIGTIVISSRFGTPTKPSDHHHDGHPALVRSSSLLERFRSLHFYKHDAAFPETEYLQPVHDSPQLVRTPSLIERVWSFKFGVSNSFEPTGADAVSVQPDDPQEQPTEPQLARTPSLLERLKSMKFSSLYRSDSIKATGEGLEREADVPESKEDHDADNLVRRSKSESSNGTSGKLPEKMKKSASDKAASRTQEEEEGDRRTPESETARYRAGIETASFVDDETVDAKADDFINRFKQQLRLQRLNSVLRYREMIRAS
ncbi:pathogen-associated molecular patterns-induced protein A70-like [Neltuma alba]|uniref:pathogen-associated molecular patterns-induced protein A70-like n=1 Tax=Neltuma alba TaxID=207710 RepID=UPI0010A513D6|nr:pathogen-associated molecular patterns-induced protein A70-like [Prosopis alba]XP_028777921.1 pathogen-associated molecular patterns-induced protein A70-like [Prosopis alba]